MDRMKANLQEEKKESKSLKITISIFLAAYITLNPLGIFSLYASTEGDAEEEINRKLHPTSPRASSLGERREQEERQQIESQHASLLGALLCSFF